MSGLWAEIALILVFITANGFFAAAEISLVSARKAPMAALAAKGDRRAQLVVRLQNDPETFLATVQVGISLMTILAGVTGGAVFVQALQGVLADVAIPWVRSAAAGIAFVLVTLAITYLSMVLGELVPKSVVLRHPERWAMRLVRPIYVLSRVSYPAVKALAASGKWLATLVGGGKIGHATFITEDEVRWLLREGHKQGVFDETERELIAQVFSFADTQVRRAMTARIDVAAVDRSWPQDRVLQFITSEGYSRYPVYEETLDRVVGIIHTKDVITVLTSGGSIIIDDLIRPPAFVPDSQPLGPLLRRMQRRQEHMAIVLDEFGGTAGLITLEDLLEEIVGEIRDEHDTEITEFSIDKVTGRARIAGKMPIDEFNEYFGTDLDERVADTVAGHVVSVAGRIPDAGDIVDAGSVRFRIIAVHDHRIDWLEGEKIQSSAEDEEPGS